MSTHNVCLSNPSLVLVQPRKTHPYITEKLLMGRKESNQTNRQTLYVLRKETTCFNLDTTFILTLFQPMDFSLRLHTIMPGWFIIYIKGSH